MASDSSTRALAASLGIAAFATLFAALPVLPARAAYSPSAEGTGLAVVTDHAEATRAALDALHAGGNAVDGAIAAALVDGVVGPNSSGLGGGGFALVYVAKEHRTYALDFRETAPSEVSVEGIVQRAEHEEATRRGVSVGVPGEPAGLEWLARKLGRRTLVEDAQEAVAIATRGYPAARSVLRGADWARTEMLASPQLQSMFFLPGGATLPFGHVVANPDLAKTLARFGREGAKPFYEGDIASHIIAAANVAGGTLKVEDFAAYKPVEREPLVRNIDGRNVVTFPAPSAGGLMLLEVLEMYGATRASRARADGVRVEPRTCTRSRRPCAARSPIARASWATRISTPSVAAHVAEALDAKQLAGAARPHRAEPHAPRRPISARARQAPRTSSWPIATATSSRSRRA